MAKRRWWQWIFFWTRVAAQAAEDGDIGSGRKTEKLGRVGGNVLDSTEVAIGGSDK